MTTKERVLNYINEFGSITTLDSIKDLGYTRLSDGIPMEMIEDVQGFEDISIKMLRGGKEFFALKVKGNSMEPNYLNNDILIIEKTSEFENNQDCIICVNGNDATFKRVIKNKDGIILQPLNPNYEIKFYSNKEIEKLPVRILGVVREIRRMV